MGPSSGKLKRHNAIRRKELCAVTFKCFLRLTVANWKQVCCRKQLKLTKKQALSRRWRFEQLLFDDRPNRIPGQRAADIQQSGAEHQLNQ